MPYNDGLYHKPLPFMRFLDSVGNGSGTKDLNGNYSVTPQSFKMIVPAGVTYVVNQFTVHIGDNGTFSVDQFGSMAALANGCLMNMQINGIVYSLLDNTAIKNNGNFFHFSAATDLIVAFSGTGNLLQSTFTGADFGCVAMLNGDLGDYLEIIIQDNLTGLTNFHAIARGYI